MAYVFRVTGSLKSLSAASIFRKLYSKISNYERDWDNTVLRPTFDHFLYGRPITVSKLKGD